MAACPQRPADIAASATRKRNLLFVTSLFFHPSWPCLGQSGGTISNYLLIKALTRSYDVTVLAMHRMDQDYGIFARDGISVITCPDGPSATIRSALGWYARVQEATRETLSTLDDVQWLVATTATLPALALAERGRGLKSCAIVRAYENLGLFPPKVSFRMRTRILGRWIKSRGMDGALLRGCDVVLTNSDFMSNMLHDRMGVDPDAVRVLPPICDIAGCVGSAPGNTVGFVDKTSDKNFRLVRDLARLAPDLEFRVYGHAPRREAESHPNISFMGWSSDRRAMYASAGVWIMPSLWAEPLGRVSIEAQACGRPVVVANVGGLPETVVEPRWLVDGYDPATWLERIRAALRTEKDVLAVNQARIAEKYSLDAHRRVLLDVFRSSPGDEVRGA